MKLCLLALLLMLIMDSVFQLGYWFCQINCLYITYTGNWQINFNQSPITLISYDCDIKAVYIYNIIYFFAILDTLPFLYLKTSFIPNDYIIRIENSFYFSNSFFLFFLYVCNDLHLLFTYYTDSNKAKLIKYYHCTWNIF